MVCPICGSAKLKRQKIETQEAGQGGIQELFTCQNCTVLFDAEHERDRSEVYVADYAAWGGDGENQEVAASKRKAFKEQLKILTQHLKPQGLKLLDVGTANGYLLEVARALGFEVYGTEISPSSLAIAQSKFPGRISEGALEKQNFETESLDVVTLTDVLEHLNDPQQTMAEIKRLLRPGGWLLIISPNNDSWTRQIFKRSWFQYKAEHLFYFNRKSLVRLLEQNNFQLKEFKNNHKYFSLAYYNAYFRKYSFGFLGKMFLIIYPRLPRFVQSFSFSNPVTGEFLALAQKNEKHA